MRGNSYASRNLKKIIKTPKSKPFVPTYGGKIGGAMSNGAGWGGEPKTAMKMLKRGMQGKKK